MATLDGDYNSIDPSNVSMWPTALRYGGIAAAILIILGLVMHLSGMVDYAAAAAGETGAASIIQNIITYAVWIGSVVMAIKFHRDQELGGYISFGRAFGEGFATSLIMGLITAVWTYIFFSFIAGDALEMMMEGALESMSDSEADAAGGILSTMMSPGVMAGMAFGGTIVLGAIISLIAGAVMKKENPNSI